MITLPTSPETRAKLVAKGWRLHKASHANELWHSPDGRTGMSLLHDIDPQPYPVADYVAVSFAAIVEFASILGIGGIGQQEGDALYMVRNLRRGLFEEARAMVDEGHPPKTVDSLLIRLFGRWRLPDSPDGDYAPAIAALSATQAQPSTTEEVPKNG